MEKFTHGFDWCIIAKNDQQERIINAFANKISKFSKSHWRDESGSKEFFLHVNKNGEYFGGFREQQYGFLEITFDEFLKITKKEIDERFPFEINKEQFKSLYDVSCTEWKSKLLTFFSGSLIDEEPFLVEEHVYNQIKKAVCSEQQEQALEKVFGPGMLIEKDTLVYIKKEFSDMWQMRYYSHYDEKTRKHNVFVEQLTSKQIEKDGERFLREDSTIQVKEISLTNPLLEK